MTAPFSLLARLATVVLLGLTLCQPAHAYIDPNAGGMLFQLLAPVFAAIVGGWIFLRRWIAEWSRRLFRKILGRKPE